MKYFSTKLMQAVVKSRRTLNKLEKTTSDQEYEKVVLEFAHEHGYYVKGC
jgi:hypothetical protein